MSVDPRQIRSESFAEIGSVIQKDAGVVIGRWSQRAVKEQPNAKRAHHEVLLDHLPSFLSELGRGLAESGDEDADGHCKPARKHGEQRWEAGWSITEVVRDYQILRLVLVDYLEENLERPLESREVMGLGLALDEAITASVAKYMQNRDEALHQNEQALKEADRRKDEFLAMLGHELRNPLAPIQNALHVLELRRGDLTTVDWARDLMGRQVQHMTRMVEDLLDVSRISSGKIALRRERLDLVALAEVVVDDHGNSLNEAGLNLTLDLPPEPVWVDGDSTRLAQVLGNLLHNAIKFTDRGGQITVRLARDEPSQRAVVRVRDSGVGIEAGLVPRIFDTFMQADRSLERTRNGLGLGLALVKGLLALHGGDVRAQSAGVGRGTEFTLTLPIVAAPTVPPPTASARPTVKPLRILLVEDNRDAADSLKLLLELHGHRVAVAYSGPAGVEVARREQPDVVLCDLGLPGMSGFAVAAALRADPATVSARLFAVSGHGSEADQQRCREAGFEIHLTKPVEWIELQKSLARPAERALY